MGYQDLIITPIYLFVFILIGIWVRPHLANRNTKKYFIPALILRFGGAIALGLIYQFHYGGGDTFNYWTHGSQWIWKAFLEDPAIAVELIFNENIHTISNFEYAQKILFFFDPDSYFVIRIAGIFDILSLGTYSTNSLFFAGFSFIAAWMLFSTLSKHYPKNTKALSFAILFFPSIVFWGSGLLKDSITLSALFLLVNALFQILTQKKYKFFNFLIIVFSCWLLYNIKPYILFCTIPALATWLYSAQIKKIGSAVLKAVIAPFLIGIFGLFGFIATTQATLDNSHYSLDNIAERAWITAYDIRFYTGKNAGSGYTLGEQDGSWQGMLALAPAAVNVSFFRPYLWEVQNPLMLLMALESLIILLLFFRFVWTRKVKYLLNDPFLIFCLCFSLVFAFAVGVSTYNFGTLMRYRIPLLSFFLIPILISKRDAVNTLNR